MLNIRTIRQLIALGEINKYEILNGSKLAHPVLANSVLFPHSFVSRRECNTAPPAVSIASASVASSALAQIRERTRKSKENFKQNVANDKSFTRFLLEKGLYGSVAYLVANAIQEYKSIDEELDKINQEVQGQALENKNMFEQIRISLIQTKLFFTTLIDKGDQKQYQETENSITERLGRLNKHLNNLKRLAEKLSDSARFGIYNSGHLKQRVEDFQEEIVQQIRQLEIARNCNLASWQHKNRQYSEGIETINKVLGDLGEYKGEYNRKLAAHEKDAKHKPPIKPIFTIDHILGAAYCTQGKLHACLSKTTENVEERIPFSNSCLANYEEAERLLKSKQDGEYAVLLSSMAYLHNDRANLWNDPKELEEARNLRQRALLIRPNDKHIICGLGLDIYKIEKMKPACDLAKLQLAYGLFSKAVWLDEQETVVEKRTPNIYVARGRLSLDLKDDAAALRDFDRALAIDPGHSDANTEKAKLLWKLGRCDDAEQAYGVGLIRDLDSPLSRGEKYKATQKYEQSLQSPPCPPLSRLDYFQLYKKWHAMPADHVQQRQPGCTNAHKT
jgi:hypothetical protein